MDFTLILIGDVFESDLKLLKKSAESRGIAILCKNTFDDLNEIIKSKKCACVSYVPEKENDINNLFTNLPLGTNEYFALFQKIETDDIPVLFNKFPFSGFFKSPLSLLEVHNIFNTIEFHSKFTDQYKGIVSEVLKYRKQKYQLITLNTALSSKRNLDNLLSLILKESCDIMSADAGSIYVREKTGPGGDFIDKLRFKVSQNYSIDLKPMKEFTIDIDENRIAGYVAVTGKSLNIADVYELDNTVPYNFKKDFDRRFNYRMKSMLTVPLKNMEGNVVGILQVMNKKKDPIVKIDSSEIGMRSVINFSYADEEFLYSIGALAAVSIERTQLHENIEQIFEGFIGSSIAAIDERDRVTSGHSKRVMGYALAFVDAINAASEGVFADLLFSEDRKRQFKFAALLHDIGKIGVPEGLLNKENRLTNSEVSAILSRFDLVRFKLLSSNENLAWNSLEEMEKDKLFLEMINKTGFLKDEDYEHLKVLKNKCYINSYGDNVPILTGKEYQALAVRKGNLTEKEREIINSHAVSSYRILSKIPWTKELKRIPEIAAHHHEKLDGTGYPDGLVKEEMGLEEKILSVVDIYEAIVAQDRPYKPAMPPKKGIEILRAEVKLKHLDRDVVEFFVEKEIYKIFTK